MLEVGSTLHADRRSPARPLAKANPAAGLESNRATHSGNPGNASAPAASGGGKRNGACAIAAFTVKGAVDGSRLGGLSVPKRHVQG